MKKEYLLTTKGKKKGKEEKRKKDYLLSKGIEV